MSFSASIIALALAGSAPATAEEFRQRPPEDEIVYFLLVGGDKSTQQQDIAKARKMMEE